MKRLAAVATIFAALALSAAAQRTGARGGFSGPAVSAPRSFSPHQGGFASHGSIGVRPSSGPVRFGSGVGTGISPRGPRGFSYPTAPMRYGATSGAARRMPYRSFAPDPGYGSRAGSGHDRGHGSGYGSGHGSGYGHGDGDHHHHRGVYYGGYVYPYYPWFYGGPIFTGYVDPWLFGPEDYSDDGYGGDVPAPYRDYGMQTPQPYPTEYYQGNPAMPEQDSASQQDYPAQPHAGQQYAPQPNGMAAQTPELSGSSSGASSQHAVTVIFNDGRPPVQIHNYLLTASTLTVLDPQYREIPLNNIDVRATEQANRSAGVDFRVPVKQ